MSHLSIFWGLFEPFLMIKMQNGKPEKESFELENSSLRITICHHSASLMMPNGYPPDRFLSHPHTHDRFL